MTPALLIIYSSPPLSKTYLSEALAFLEVWGTELDLSWYSVKKAERRRIDAFELCCWRRLLRVPWTAKRSNQSILKEISPGCSLVEAETPIFWPPHAKSWLIGQDPDVGKDWKQEEKGKTEDEMVGWHHWLNGHEFGWTPGVGDREAWHATVHGVTKSRT